MHCIGTSVGNKLEASALNTHKQAGRSLTESLGARGSGRVASSEAAGARPFFCSDLLLGRPALPFGRDVGRTTFAVVVVCGVSKSGGRCTHGLEQHAERGEGNTHKSRCRSRPSCAHSSSYRPRSSLCDRVQVIPVSLRPRLRQEHDRGRDPESSSNAQWYDVCPFP